MPTTYQSKNLKQYWPPSPTVEDEAESLSKEHATALPGLVGDEVEIRGSIDQQPIIVEADRQGSTKLTKTTKQRETSSSRSSSSYESLGPSTPTDQSTERRFVFRPHHSSEAHSHENEAWAQAPPRSTSGERVKQEQSRPRKFTPKPNAPRVQEGENALAGLQTSREPSPYLYSSNSGKSTLSGDLLTSPITPSPGSRYPNVTGKDGSDCVTGPLARGSPIARPTSRSSLHAEYRPSLRAMSATRHEEKCSAQSLGLDPTPRNQRSTSAFQAPARAREGVSRPALGSDSDCGQGSPRDTSMTLNSHTLYQKGRRTNSRSRVDGQDSEYAHSSQSATLPKPSFDPESRSLGQNYSTYEATSTARSAQGSKGQSPNISPYTTPPPSPKIGWSGSGNGTPVTENQDPTLVRSRPSSPYLGTRVSPRNSRSPTSIPHSPLQAKHSFERIRPGESALREKLRSRRTSPLSPAGLDRPSGRPDLRIDVQRPSPSPAAMTWPIGGPELPARPLPGELSAPFLASSPRPRTERTPSPRSSRPEPDDDPQSVFAEPVRRALSPSPLRGRTRASTSSPLVSLPPCPRREPVAAYSDWSTLPATPEFNVCPACRAGLEVAGFEGQFVPTRPKFSGCLIRCDLSVPWVRMAWLLILQGKAHHDDMIGALTTVFAHEKPCSGHIAADREWYRVYDTRREDHVPGFDMCASCVRSLEIIFPNLKGAFHLHPSISRDTKRKCKLSADSVHFPRYVDLLEEISKQANTNRREPDMTPFVQLATRIISAKECKKDNQYRGLSWHFVPHLPDFTVCEECYLGVVLPAAAAGSKVAAQFNQSPQIPPSTSANLSCQLYSRRMREAFQDSCRRNDFATLRATALNRISKERELQGLAEQTKHLPEERRAQQVLLLAKEWARWE